MTASGELSRKIAEKLGWRWKRDQSFHVATGDKYGKPWRFLIPTDSVFSGLQDADMTEEIREQPQMLPDFLSPAIFWPTFEKWRTQNGYHFRCGVGVCAYFEIYRNGTPAEFADSRGDASADLITAGCRAWLAALEAGVK